MLTWGLFLQRSLNCDVVYCPQGIVENNRKLRQQLVGLHCWVWSRRVWQSVLPKPFYPG
jgi:hypothetical protein